MTDLLPFFLPKFTKYLKKSFLFCPNLFLTSLQCLQHSLGIFEFQMADLSPFLFAQMKNISICFRKIMCPGDSALIFNLVQIYSLPWHGSRCQPFFHLHTGNAILRMNLVSFCWQRRTCCSPLFQTSS